jgi:hypothetical protein
MTSSSSAGWRPGTAVTGGWRMLALADGGVVPVSRGGEPVAGPWGRHPVARVLAALRESGGGGGGDHGGDVGRAGGGVHLLRHPARDRGGEPSGAVWSCACRWWGWWRWPCWPSPRRPSRGRRCSTRGGSGGRGCRRCGALGRLRAAGAVVRAVPVGDGAGPGGEPVRPLVAAGGVAGRPWASGWAGWGGSRSGSTWRISRC